MKKPKSNLVYLQHIREATNKIQGYLASHTYDDFVSEPWDQDAISRNIEIIGEAANNLDPLFRKKYNDIPWRQIIDFRNVVAHDYADIDVDIVWNIITKNISELSNNINNILILAEK